MKKTSYLTYDLDKVLKMTDGDMELLKELFQLFISDYPKKLSQFSQAIEEENFEVIQNIAHSLKGASGNLGLSSIYELTLKIENSAKEGDIADVKRAYKDLERELERLKEFLSEQEWMKE